MIKFNCPFVSWLLETTTQWLIEIIAILVDFITVQKKFVCSGIVILITHVSFFLPSLSTALLMFTNGLGLDIIVLLEQKKQYCIQ